MKIITPKTNQSLHIRCENRDDLTGLKYNIENTIRAVSSIWWDHLFEDAKLLQPCLTKEVLQSVYDENERLHAAKSSSEHPSTKPHAHSNEHSDQEAKEVTLNHDDDIKSKSYPPPFDFNHVEKNHLRNKELTGTNVCLNLKHICKPGASVHVIMYTLHGLHGDTLKEIGRTEKHELKSEEDISNAAMNGDNEMKDIHIQFQVMLPKIPEDCLAVSFDIKQELHDSKTSLCRVAFNPKQIDSPVFKLEMFVLTSAARSVKPSAVLAVMVMSSNGLSQFREKVDDFMSSQSIKTKPYAEKMYNSESVGGTTLILEQLYASRCSASVPASLLRLLSKERKKQYEDYLKKMKDLKKRKEKEAGSSKEPNLLETSDYDEVDCPKSYELLREEFKEYEALMEKMKRTCEFALDPTNEKVVESFKDELQLPMIPTIEGSVSYGGTVLRKSKSRNNECYQAMATNLNVNMVSSQWVPYSKSTGGRCLHNVIDVSPTITLGCPTAHCLKFKHGGLRNQFKKLAVEDRLT